MTVEPGDPKPCSVSLLFRHSFTWVSEAGRETPEDWDNFSKVASIMYLWSHVHFTYEAVG